MIARLKFVVPKVLVLYRYDVQVVLIGGNSATFLHFRMAVVWREVGMGSFSKHVTNVFITVLSAKGQMIYGVRK